jgi:hypothetical protein
MNSFKCPSIFAHLFKTAYFKALEDHTVQDLGPINGMRMSNIEVFSPFGFVCDVWGKITGRGNWNATSFKYQTSHKSWVFCANYIPENIINEYCPNRESDCPFRLLLSYGVNNVSVFSDNLKKMEDFSFDIFVSNFVS